MDLYRLLKFGMEGPLKIGASLAQSRGALQSLFPRNTVKMENMNGMVVLFTELVELHIFGNRLVNVIIKASACRRKGELHLGEVRPSLSRTTSIETVIRLLHLANIDWCVHQPLSDGKSVTLLTEGGATIEFVAEANRMLINRIHLTEGLEPAFASNG